MDNGTIFPIYVQNCVDNNVGWYFSDKDDVSTTSPLRSVSVSKWTKVTLSTKFQYSQYKNLTELGVLAGGYNTTLFEVRVKLDQAVSTEFAEWLQYYEVEDDTSFTEASRYYKPTCLKLTLNGHNIGYWDCMYVSHDGSDTVTFGLFSNFLSVLDRIYWTGKAITSLQIEAINITYVMSKTNSINPNALFTYRFNAAQRRWDSDGEIPLTGMDSINITRLDMSIENCSYLANRYYILQRCSAIAWRNSWIMDIHNQLSIDMDENIPDPKLGYDLFDYLVGGTSLRGVTYDAELVFHLDFSDWVSTAAPLPTIGFRFDNVIENLQIRIDASHSGYPDNYNESDIQGVILGYTSSNTPKTIINNSYSLILRNCTLHNFCIYGSVHTYMIDNCKISSQCTDTFGEFSGTTSTDGSRTYYVANSSKDSNVKIASPISNMRKWIATALTINNSIIDISRPISITNSGGGPVTDSHKFYMYAYSNISHSSITIVDNFDENVENHYIMSVALSTEYGNVHISIEDCDLFSDSGVAPTAVTDVIQISVEPVTGSTIRINNCSYNIINQVKDLFYFKN